MISQACRWTQTPSTTPLQSKNEILIFGLRSTSDNQPGWSMDSSPICHPSLAKKMKCSFLDYVQLLIIGQAGRWTQTPSATPLQLIKWNAHFWNTFNFWWSAWLVNGLEPHLPALSSQKNEILLFGIHSTSDDWPGWSMDSNPIHHPSPAKKNEMLVFRLRSLLMICLADWWTWTPSATPLQPKKWNAHFWIMLNFWWLARLVDGLKPHPPPLFSQKMKSSFLDYVQLLMINQAGQWTRTPSATPLQPIKWNAHFWITFTLDDWPGWSMDSNLIHHPSPANKMKCSYFDYVQLLMISLAGQWTQNPSATPLQPIKWNASFWIVFTSDDQPGWLMDLNPICHPSPANEMKCSFLDYIHFGWSARLVNGIEPHLPALFSQKKWNATFWITFNFWWSAGLVNGLEPHPPPVSSQKNEMLIFWLCSLQMIGQAGQWTQTPSATPLQPKKWNAHFCITINFWFRPDWSMDSNPIHHQSLTNKMKCLILDYAQLLMIGWAGWRTWTPSATPLQSKNEILIFGFCPTSDD